MKEWSTVTRDDIFLISDSTKLRRRLASAVGDVPVYMSVEQTSTEELLEMIGSVRPTLVVIDLTFREGHGSQLIRRLTARQSSPLILAIGPRNSDHASQARRALIAGATGYLTRSEAMDHLEQAVKCMISGDIFLSDQTKEVLHQPASRGSRLHQMASG